MSKSKDSRWTGDEGWDEVIEILVGSSNPDEEAPTYVTALPRLKNEPSLWFLFKGNRLPVRNIRCNDSTNFFYGFGDASGTSLGSSFEKNGYVEFEYGQWCTKSSEESSNWRELKNVVEAIKGFVKRHELQGSEIFIFTDNSTAEAAFWKGLSTSEKLFEERDGNAVLETFGVVQKLPWFWEFCLGSSSGRRGSSC